MTAEANWYDDGSGRMRWWDGAQWTDQFQDGGQVQAEQPVLVFHPEIQGLKTLVSVFQDRIEWAQTSGGVSAAKLTAGILTAGLSLAATGVGRGGYSAGKTTDLSIIQFSDVTGIVSAKAGNRVLITVSTPSTALVLSIPKKEAEQVARLLQNLVAASRQPQLQQQQAAPITVHVAAPAVATRVQMPVDAVAQLQQLADLHRQGILSDAEFVAAKAKALGIG